MGFGVMRLDRGDDGRSAGGRPGVHDDDAVLADLDADVPAGAGDHEEVGPDLQHLQPVCRCGARGLRCQRCRRDRRTTINHEQRRTYRDGDGERSNGGLDCVARGSQRFGREA